jgi:hypothetical protein
MDADTASYIVRYYSHLMTTRENLAYRHLTATVKSTHGHSDLAAHHEARNRASHLRTMLSDNPEVLSLADGGLERFLERTAQRIISEHGKEIVLNRCPKCGALAKTPTARQCRFCRHDWHDTNHL